MSERKLKTPRRVPYAKNYNARENSLKQNMKIDAKKPGTQSAFPAF